MRNTMKLAIGLDLYRDSAMRVPVDDVRFVESLGYHSVWTAEAYGSDALSPLAYLAGLTDQIKLATGVVQVAARTPAATAMHAMTIDALAGGDRVIIGLGVSGPQIVEGWYGRPWGKPNAVLRDYVAIMRKVLRREEPLTHDGSQIALPYVGEGAVGSGKPLKSIMHPNANIEIWIAAGGPLNVGLAAEIADGWLPMGYGPDATNVYGDTLGAGFARRTERDSPRDDFDIFGGVSVEITDDVAAAIAARKPLSAMYVGGMGSADHNFHRDAMARRGFADEATRIQELWLAGEKEAAVAAVPDEYIEQGALLGSPQRIATQWPGVCHEGLTGLVVRTPNVEAYELLADLAGIRDRDDRGDNK